MEWVKITDEHTRSSKKAENSAASSDCLICDRGCVSKICLFNHLKSYKRRRYYFEKIATFWSFSCYMSVLVFCIWSALYPDLVWPQKYLKSCLSFSLSVYMYRIQIKRKWHWLTSHHACLGLQIKCIWIRGLYIIVSYLWFM